MPAADLAGYKGPSLKLLEDAGVEIGDVVSVEVGGSSRVLVGTLVPRYQYDDDDHIVIKLKSGYNVGIATRNVSRLERTSKGEKPAFRVPSISVKPGLPTVPILGTGGTIASRVDYRTGGVHPATSAEELYSLFPELSEVATIRPEVILSVFSENLEPKDWTTIAEKVAEQVGKGVSGVVITTGTDTMGYTAAALGFALRGVPIPVFVVGSQRSSDRPSSDAYLNLVGATTLAATADFSGVFVAMHATTDDKDLAIHLGTRVRKNHTSTRDAFESIGVEPVAEWSAEAGLRKKKEVLLTARGTTRLSLRPRFEDSVALVKFYPSMPAAFLESILRTGVKGIVIEGSGLGHINSKNIDVLRRYVEQGRTTVCMTSQCIWGRVDLDVYDTGRDLAAAGVIPLGDTLPETALVKLMWVIANMSSAEEAARLMRTDLAGELSERTMPRKRRVG